MNPYFKNILQAFLCCCIAMLLSGCSEKETIRMPQDILGVWCPTENYYLEFSEDNEVHNLSVEFQDGKSIGNWTTEVYYYEPGYNLVIYLTALHEAIVYEIVTLTDSEMTWCPVDSIDIEKANSNNIGMIIGDIIKKAQEGYELNPELYQNFTKIPEDVFLNIVDSLDLEYWL